MTEVFQNLARQFIFSYLTHEAQREQQHQQHRLQRNGAQDYLDANSHSSTSFLQHLQQHLYRLKNRAALACAIEGFPFEQLLKNVSSASTNATMQAQALASYWNDRIVYEYLEGAWIEPNVYYSVPPNSIAATLSETAFRKRFRVQGVFHSSYTFHSVRLDIVPIRSEAQHLLLSSSTATTASSNTSFSSTKTTNPNKKRKKSDSPTVTAASPSLHASLSHQQQHNELDDNNEHKKRRRRRKSKGDANSPANCVLGSPRSPDPMTTPKTNSTSILSPKAQLKSPSLQSFSLSSPSERPGVILIRHASNVGMVEEEEEKLEIICVLPSIPSPVNAIHQSATENGSTKLPALTYTPFSITQYLLSDPNSSSKEFNYPKLHEFLSTTNLPSALLFHLIDYIIGNTEGPLYGKCSGYLVNRLDYFRRMYLHLYEGKGRPVDEKYRKTTPRSKEDMEEDEDEFEEFGDEDEDEEEEEDDDDDDEEMQDFIVDDDEELETYSATDEDGEEEDEASNEELVHNEPGKEGVADAVENEDEAVFSEPEPESEPETKEIPLTRRLRRLRGPKESV